MKSNNFLQRYLISITDRLICLATIISFAFWLFGTFWKIYTFNGSLFDIIVVSAGLGSTFFCIFCPTQDSLTNIFSVGITKSKRYFAQVCNAFQTFAILWIWSGVMALVALFVGKQPFTDFIIVPGIFGVLGIIVILLFPTEDVVWED